MYKVRICRHRNPVRPLDSHQLDCSSLSLITLHPAGGQSRSRHMLYAVRYAPCGRGHAITNWQCTSQLVNTLFCRCDTRTQRADCVLSSNYNYEQCSGSEPSTSNEVSVDMRPPLDE